MPSTLARFAPIRMSGRLGALRVGTIYQVRLEAEPDRPARAEAGGSLLRFSDPDGSWYLPEGDLEEARRLGFRLRVLRSIPASEIPVRFVLPGDVAISSQPPAEARLAVLARLLSEQRARAEVEVRYLGRNRTVPPDAFVLDRAGGRRTYVWQVVPASGPETSGELQDRFAALRELFADPDARIALALGSGGLKLFAHAPLLGLLEAIGCADHVDEIWGSSGGAIAGLLYSLGLSPQAIEQAGYDLYSGRYSLPITPSRLNVLRHLLRDTLFSEPGEAGFCDGGGPLDSMIEHYCAALEPRRRFYAVAFNLEECRTQALTAEPVPDHLADLLVHTDARAATLASSAVPLLFLPRAVRRGEEEVHFIDGSTTEDVPLYSVAAKWDRDRAAGVEPRSRLVILYVKLTGGVAQYQTKSPRIGKLRMMQLVASAGTETMFRRDLELLGARSDVELLGVELGNSGPDFFEIQRIPEFVRRAKECFPRQLLAIEEGLRSR